MNKQMLYCFLFLSYFSLIIILCELLHRRGVAVEYTRKLAHALATLSCLFATSCFSSHWYVSGLIIATFSILYIGCQKKLFPSINSVSRKTCGAYMLPVSIGLVYYLSLYLKNELFFILPVVILAISDSLACILGRNYKSKIIVANKTLIGSIVFFLSTFILSSFILWFSLEEIRSIGIALGVSVIATGVELISPNGSDNLTIPLLVIASLLLFNPV
jgi:dolichol kinase